MIKSLFGTLAKLALLAASAAFLTAVSLLVLGAFLSTFPVLRMSPRDRRIKAAMDMVVAGVALAASFKPVDGPGIELRPAPAEDPGA